MARNSIPKIETAQEFSITLCSAPETMNFATSAKQVSFLVKYFNGELLLKIHRKLSVQA